MPDTNIIEIPRLSPQGRPSAGTGGFGMSGTQSPSPALAGTASSIVHGSVVHAPIEIDKLYPAEGGLASDLISALGLLADAIGMLEKARAALRGKEAVTADRYAQRFQMLLPDLFKHRKVGDGYGVIVNSLHFALVNQRGKPLSFDQLTTIWRVIRELRNAPFVRLEPALRFVQELEDCHLQIYPAAISGLIEEPEDE
jgi:hypothetical protein